MALSKKLTLSLISLFLAGFVHAQSKVGEKFSLSISAGPAFPLGVFAKKDIADAVIYNPVRNPPDVSTIAKSKSGFAKAGYSFQAELKYKFAKHFYTFLRAGITVNPISVSEMEDFFIDLYEREQRFSHVDNQLFTVIPGLGYSMEKNKWRYNAGLFVGYGRINYPYYENALVFTGIDIIWAHSGPRPDLNSIVSGGLAQISREIGKFNLGLDVHFQSANFEYTIYPRTIPGGSQTETYDDTIKARILSVGLLLSYQFNYSTK